MNALNSISVNHSLLQNCHNLVRKETLINFPKVFTNYGDTYRENSLKVTKEKALKYETLRLKVKDLNFPILKSDEREVLLKRESSLRESVEGNHSKIIYLVVASVAVVALAGFIAWLIVPTTLVICVTLIAASIATGLVASLFYKTISLGDFDPDVEDLKAVTERLSKSYVGSLHDCILRYFDYIEPVNVKAMDYLIGQIAMHYLKKNCIDEPKFSASSIAEFQQDHKEWIEAQSTENHNV